MKMEYIKGDTFIGHVMKFDNKHELNINLINSYNHLLKGLSKLISNRIVHFDLKGNNILFRNEMRVPIIIDFGLSISIDEMEEADEEKLKQYFYVYAPEYYIWPIEVHYLNYILHVNKNPTNDELLRIATEYVRENPILSNMFTYDFRLKYVETCMKQLKKYNKMSNAQRITYILNNWFTWDNYSLSFIFFKLFLYININGFLNNNFIIYFSKILLMNIHPNPNKRMGLTQNIHNFNQFFYGENYDKKTFNDIKDKFEDNINLIDKAKV